MNVDQLHYVLGMAGTVAFAVTAVLAVTPRGIDLYGACVLGLITAIGGGTIRDVILDMPVFWSVDLNYIWVALVSSVVAFLGNRLVARKSIYSLMLYIDAAGVSMFSIDATHKVLQLNFGLPLAPILLGVLTAIGGGLMRDMLAGKSTLLMSRELYAIPVTIGCVLYVVLVAWWPGNAVLIGTCCATLTMIMRSVVIHWGFTVPIWMTIQPKQD